MTRGELKRQIKRVQAVAEQTGDRAYTFCRDGDGLVEIRVWPDGRATLTPVDERGQPTAEPRRLRHLIHWV